MPYLSLEARIDARAAALGAERHNARYRHINKATV
jgi:hypothetical protein